MPKKRTNPDESRELILGSAMRLVRRRGAAGVTVSDVATEAGCAKGLVHYHFSTKQRLWDAVAGEMARDRGENWRLAFEAGGPTDVVQQSWELLVEESVNGTVLAWTSLFGPGTEVSEQLANSSIAAFSDLLGQSVGAMLDRHGSSPRVQPAELGWLLSCVIAGVGFLLLGGAERRQMENAYAAAWLGILSLAD